MEAFVSAGLRACLAKSVAVTPHAHLGTSLGSTGYFLSNVLGALRRRLGEGLMELRGAVLLLGRVLVDLEQVFSPKPPGSHLSHEAVVESND